MQKLQFLALLYLQRFLKIIQKLRILLLMRQKNQEIDIFLYILFHDKLENLMWHLVLEVLLAQNFSFFY